MENKTYPFSERRSARRKQARLTLHYTIEEKKESFVAATIDISSKSVSFEYEKFIPQGTKLSGELLLPLYDDAVPLKGSILRVEEGQKGSPYIFILVFTSIATEDQLRLDEYIQSLDLSRILSQAIKNGASDIHLIADQPPVMRIGGNLYPLENFSVVSAHDVRKMILGMMSPLQQERFAKEMELDFSYLIPEGRFRVNAHLEKGNVGVAMRVIPPEIRTFEELGLPDIVGELALRRRGLIVVTGPAGSGKSTSQAAMIDLINRERSSMIISIEDPIEYVHRSKKSIIKQREIGEDTLSFASALKHVLRQDPNVILVGEMRDLESISIAMTAAETGHLLLTTLHTLGAVEAINRIIDVHPASNQPQIRSQLAECLEGVVYQLLVPRKNGDGKILATEVMIGTTAVRNIIRLGKIEQIYSYLETGSDYGMHSMDDSLLKLCLRDLITRETALSYARDPKKLESKLC